MMKSNLTGVRPIIFDVLEVFLGVRVHLLLLLLEILFLLFFVNGNRDEIPQSFANLAKTILGYLLAFFALKILKKVALSKNFEKYPKPCGIFTRSLNF